MKLLVKYAGKRKRAIIEVNPDTLISTLKKQIQAEFKFLLIPFRLFGIICSDFRVLLPESFPVSFFNFSEGDIIEVDDYGASSVLLHKKCRNSTYLDLLGVTLPVKLSEKPDLDEIINHCKLGDLVGLVNLVDRLKFSNPEDDILNQTHPNLWKPIHYACYHGHSNIVKYLIDNRANVNRVTIDEWTALQLACFMGHLECVLALFSHKNLQINKMTRFRGSGLHLGCEQNAVDIVKALLSKNASVTLNDPYDRSTFEMTKNQEILYELAYFAGQQEIERYTFKDMSPFISEVWLTGMFFIHDRPVILFLDTQKGLLNRFGSKEKYQDNASPELSIRLYDVQDVREGENRVFSAKEEYYFVIETSKTNCTYYTKHYQLTVEWIDRLRVAANYFVDHKEKFNSNRDTLHNQSVAESIEDKPNVVESAPVNTEKVNFESFDVIKEIGSGSFGIVYQVRKKAEDKIFAMKSLSKRTLESHRQLKYAISECRIMKKLNHPFILTLHYAFQTNKYLYLVLDYCEKGTLSELISIRNKLDERAARFYIGEVILALEYLHSLRILYRDLKPSNILIDASGHIKLADFGLAKETLKGNSPAMSMVGSHAYLAPEIIDSKGFTPASDIYGLGLLLFEMLTGSSLFTESDFALLYKSIKSNKIWFPSYVGEQAKEFILTVMNKNPLKRPTIRKIKRFEFFKKLDWDALAQKKINPPRIYVKQSLN